MESIFVKGLVVREVQCREADKILTLLTEEYGKITVTGKGVKSMKSPHMVASQMYAYSSFVLVKSKKYFYISESELIEAFFGLRSDIDKLSLAAYIADVAEDISLENVPDPELLRLTLNTLYAVANRTHKISKIKGAYELRVSSAAGFRPDLVGCSGCGVYSSGTMYLDVMNGRLLCPECRLAELSEKEDDGTAHIHIALTPDVLEAMRYTIYSPMPRYLSFSLPDESLRLYGKATEKYLLSHIEHGFYSLDFYKSMLS